MEVSPTLPVDDPLAGHGAGVGDAPAGGSRGGGDDARITTGGGVRREKSSVGEVDLLVWRHAYTDIVIRGSQREGGREEDGDGDGDGEKRWICNGGA